MGTLGPLHKGEAMRTIWKYRIEGAGPRSNTVYIPGEYKLLHTDYQAGWICVWVEVNPDVESIPVEFLIVPTGGKVPRATYVGTAQSPPYVWHIYVKEPS